MILEWFRFLKNHRWHLLLLPILGLTVYTALHETAHACAVLLQGGEILSFRFWPTREGFGQITYQFPENASYSRSFISFAPYLLWLSLASGAAILSFCIKPGSFFRYSTLFIWLYIIPLGDTALAALPYACFDRTNDFYNTFGQPNTLLRSLILTAAFAVMFFSYKVHKNLYAHNVLKPAAFYSFALLFLLVLCLI